jgi:DNA replication and repair protein RecF
MLTHLQLTNFRCFETASVRLDPEFNFFIGDNGEGKTSVLEAICVLLRLQSQRSSSLAPLIKVGADMFSVSGIFDKHELRFRYGKLRRQIEFDGVDQRKTAEYLRLARVVSFANTDIELIRGSSEPRRRYLDFIGTQIDPTYRSSLRSYERALRSRNALLKASPVRLRELAAYDPPLIEHGVRLRTLRAQLMARLAPLVAAAYGEISNQKERVDISFAPGNEDDFASHLSRTREEQIRSRLTTVGPHRDNIDMFVDGMAAQTYASEGQQRTLALALKLGQARLFQETDSMPTFLIDDIFGELDAIRRTRLFGAFPPDAQKFVTSTTEKWPAELGETTTFRVKDRMISRGR